MTEYKHSFEANFTRHGTILCRLTTTSPEPIARPRFCFSLLDACRVVNGGAIEKFLGGFCEIRLDKDLTFQQPITVEISYAGGDRPTVNRAWLPLGAYLKFEDDHTEPFAPLPAGVFSVIPDQKSTPTGILKLVPPPLEWRSTGGLVPVTGFRASANNEIQDGLDAVNRLAARNGFSAFLTDDGLPLKVLDSEEFTGDNYQLNITTESVELHAANRKAVFYGAISLLNLRATYNDHLPLGTIADGPRFSWRGQHLDCARHFFQPETLFRFVDMMALFKLNVFHWHFADDEAFRLEIESHPKAWQKSAFRGEGQTLPGLFGGGAGPTGGSYPLAMARDLIAHAKDLEIDVLPEIEVPAHSFALATIFPELRDPSDTGQEKSVQSYPKNVINPALPATWNFLEDIAAEVADIFPFSHLHLGADELPTSTWDHSPAVDRLKERKNLQTADDVMGCTMDRLGEFVRLKGVRPCAWEEAAKGKNGGIGNGALLFSWTSQGPGLEAARNGYDVVMCPGQHVYLDMAHTDDRDDWGATWAATIGLKDTVDWEPVPSDEPELENRIIGVQGTFWSEFTTIDNQMEAMIAPRVLGVASKAWSAVDNIDTGNIVELAQAYGPVFDTIGWDWYRGAASKP